MRGFLYPYEDTAPGPLCSDAEEVIEALRDLDGVRRQYAAAYDAVPRAFNDAAGRALCGGVVARFFGPPQ